MSAVSATPVSDALEADLRAAVRRHGVVVWLDADGLYTGFVDRLIAQRASQAGPGPYAVLAFRGSYLALMLEAEGLAAGVERTAMVLHLPRFTEERVKGSPLLELYAAGVRYRKGLDTLVTEAAAGRELPDRIQAFLAEPGLSLERADAWLASLLDARAGGLSALLGATPLPALVDDLLAKGPMFDRVRADLEVLWEHLGARAGLPAAWRDMACPVGVQRPEDLAFALGSWALAVEYVHDLGRAPVSERLAPAAGLPAAVVTACCALAVHLRERHTRVTIQWADETERWLPDEVAAARPRDLGRIDTLRFEEDVVLRGALDAMGSVPEDWAAALGWAEPRLAGASFWVRQDDARLAAWQLIDAMARLGRAIAAAGPRNRTNGGLDGALEHYLRVGAAVDRAHRHLEQVRATRAHLQLPERDAVRGRLAELRGAWRTWADDWARDFNALCRREGFLPSSGLQQRTLFDEVVRPMTAESGTTALFLVDALRYEMAEELHQAVAGTPASTVQLRARLAELPTVTNVGMNVLAPVVSHGRLRPALSDGAITGFSTGEFRVHDPETRRRAMADRVGGATCPWLKLEEVLGRDSTSLKQTVARARLVVVHSEEIDLAGEHGLGPNVFESVLQRLRAAWQMLREAGVRRFVITADHGYLLLDETARESAQPHGRPIDAKRRAVWSPVAADHTGEARVALADLGYEGAPGHLMFPESTAIFDTGKRSMSFVHGGNSLQERVIPVLTLVHRAAVGADTQRYAIDARRRDGVAGLCCVEVQIEAIAQGTLVFGGAREIDLALRIADGPRVEVEICDVRGAGRRQAGAIRVRVGEPCEIFFRLTGPDETRAALEVYHPGAEAEVQPCVLESRFEVTVQAGHAPPGTPSGRQESASPAVWLSALPEGGPRQVFAHIAAYGAITEAEALGMFGNPRGLRAFALAFETYAARAPFGVGIESVGGLKRYVRVERGG